MKLRNKKTGEIGKPAFIGVDYEITILPEDKNKKARYYNSLAELNEEWEDAPEEPKEWWYIDIHGPHKVTNNDEYYQQIKDASKEVGNYFSSREEAELAVRKLKAWQRLKDKGFRFRWIDMQTGQVKYGLFLKEGQKVARGDEDDLLLLFGGEE